MKKCLEGGFSLIELVVALGIMALILPVLANLSFQTIFFPPQRQAELAVLNDLNNAYYWFSYDLAGGPQGNNLSASSTRPPYASVSIGPSPGYPGNNSVTIVYNTWPEPGSIGTTQRVIIYQLERQDPFDPNLRLVRIDETGKQVVAFRIADPAHVVFSGSAMPGSPGGVPPGLTLSITSTMEGGRGPISRDASFVFAMPRTYQPPAPPPPPALITWNVNLPGFLPARSGYWQVIATAAEGSISAEWATGGSDALSLYVYGGNPLGGVSGDRIDAPATIEAPVVASGASTTGHVALSVTAQPAAMYTVYFFNASGSYVSTAIATVTYMSFGSGPG